MCNIGIQIAEENAYDQTYGKGQVQMIKQTEMHFLGFAYAINHNTAKHGVQSES